MNEAKRLAELAASPWTVPAALRSATVCASAAERTAWLRARLGEDAEPLSGEVDILTALRDLARARLIETGAWFELIVDDQNPGQEILDWRFLSLRLPPALLAAAACKHAYAPPLEIRLLPKAISPAPPLAHLHLHLKAAGSFEVLWAGLAGSGLRRCNTPVHGIDAGEWNALLRRAMIARLLLDRCLRAPDCATLERAATRLFGAHSSLILDAARELLGGRVSRVDRSREAELARRLGHHSRPPSRTTLDQIWRGDPLDHGAPWPEGAFLSRAFRAWADSASSELKTLFVQYLRIKCLLHAHLVFDPLDKGLSQFVGTFERLWEYRSVIERVLPELAASESGIAAAAIEVRASPGTIRENVALVREVAAAPGDHERAIVFHLIRDRSKDHRRVLIGLLAKARALIDTLRTDPRQATIIRGVDFAGDETEVPLFLAVPALRFLRAESRALGARYGLPGLQLSLHVGEGFEHLLGGLRRVHEPIVWRLAERGDRLAHALALGVDLERWCASHPTVQVPRWVRWIDLAWARTTLQAHAGTSALAAIDRELVEVGGRCFPNGPRDPERLARVHALLGEPGLLERVLDPSWRSREPGDDESLVAALVRSSDRQLLDELEAVSAASDEKLLEQLSGIVSRDIARRSLTIEVNPSSNLLIGDLEQPLDQPMFRLHPLDDREIALPITISADDPLTFSTCLADEYAYAWAGMVVHGKVSPERARMWLDASAAASWRARFTSAARARRPSAETVFFQQRE